LTDDPSILFVSLVSAVVGAVIGAGGAIVGGLVTAAQAHSLSVAEERRRDQRAALEEMRLRIVDPMKKVLRWETTRGRAPIRVWELWPPILDGMLEFMEDWELRWAFVVADAQLRASLKTVIDALWAVDRGIEAVMQATPGDRRRIGEEEFVPAWRHLADNLNAVHWNIQGAGVDLVRGPPKRKLFRKKKPRPPRRIPDLQETASAVADELYGQNREP
jgi:hypothetical protein